MITRFAAGLIILVGASYGAQAHEGYHGHYHHYGYSNWWVAPAVIGGLLGGAALAYPYYYGYSYSYPFYSPYPYYQPQPRVCQGPYGWFPC